MNPQFQVTATAMQNYRQGNASMLSESAVHAVVDDYLTTLCAELAASHRYGNSFEIRIVLTGELP